jgi:hypothetical protein
MRILKRLYIINFTCGQDRSQLRRFAAIRAFARKHPPAIGAGCINEYGLNFIDSQPRAICLANT